MSCEGSGQLSVRRKTQALGRAGVAVGIVVFFFFSSRRRHTRLQGDWSSDVCSSDLGLDHREEDAGEWCEALPAASLQGSRVNGAAPARYLASLPPFVQVEGAQPPFDRSEERRVGKECRSRWSPYH